MFGEKTVTDEESDEPLGGGIIAGIVIGIIIGFCVMPGLVCLGVKIFMKRNLMELVPSTDR